MGWALKTLTLVAVVAIASATGDAVPGKESICGTDHARPAVAVKYVEATKYKLAKSVARLRLRAGWCTAWLWGSEGHLITNNHCIRSQDDASAAIVEFGAECATATNPNNGMRAACGGTFVANSSTLIISDTSLDFSLVQLHVNRGINLTKFGYLQARASAATLNEPVYTIGHPDGRPKSIAYLSDGGRPSRITNVSTPSECGGSDTLAYNVDTEGGSSGSAIISAIDNKVVALHNCGGCTSTGGANTGHKLEYIIKLLKSKNLLPKDAIAARC
ncbi:hypothetical protein H310_07456 [Aphanomyces invadans]|uniref:Serine protease n=1 Tax=Aphanomyces invadans TaxID=157072 RepID=A0A024U0S4_9STRA|nr:hypothetical protein H310_07456 [Aphanomyces invadans]ETW00016.1 hypothetical protein H310_07456 [Aphanomyces invadans]|eukprot:XP_008871041.1 hypothetical protein H310_07456 [Aphanomyces invadans]